MSAQRHKRHPERDLQYAVMNYFRSVCPEAEAIHIPNGGYRRVIEASILKGMGVKAGVPDILVMWSPAKFGFIELKAPRQITRLSDAQKSFMGRLKILGIPCSVVSSLDSLASVIREWGIPNREVRK